MEARNTAKEANVNGMGKYFLRLYITGVLPNSANAVVNLKTICEKYLNGLYELNVIDIYQQPDLALEENIMAIPLSVKKSPLPEVRLIGDLSYTGKVLKTLDLTN